MPPIELVLEILWGTVLPVAGVTAILWFSLSLVVGVVRAPALAAVALGMGLAFGNYWKGDDGLPWLPDGQARHWLLALACSTLLAGLAAGWLQVPRATVWIVAANQALLAALLLALPAWREVHLLWVVWFGCVVAGNWLLLDQSCRQAPGGLLPFAVGLAFLNSALVLSSAGSSRPSELALVLGGGYLGVALTGLVRRVDARGAVGAAAVMIPGLMLVAVTENAPEDWRPLALAGISPLGLAVTLLPPIRSWRGWRLALIQAVLLLLPMAAAVGLTLQGGGGAGE